MSEQSGLNSMIKKKNKKKIAQVKLRQNLVKTYFNGMNFKAMSKLKSNLRKIRDMTAAREAEILKTALLLRNEASVSSKEVQLTFQRSSDYIRIRIYDELDETGRTDMIFVQPSTSLTEIKNEICKKVYGILNMDIMVNVTGWPNKLEKDEDWTKLLCHLQIQTIQDRRNRLNDTIEQAEVLLLQKLSSNVIVYNNDLQQEQELNLKTLGINQLHEIIQAPINFKGFHLRTCKLLLNEMMSAALSYFRNNNINKKKKNSNSNRSQGKLASSTKISSEQTAADNIVNFSSTHTTDQLKIAIMIGNIMWGLTCDEHCRNLLSEVECDRNIVAIIVKLGKSLDFFRGGKTIPSPRGNSENKDNNSGGGNSRSMSGRSISGRITPHTPRAKSMGPYLEEYFKIMCELLNGLMRSEKNRIFLGKHPKLFLTLTTSMHQYVPDIAISASHGLVYLCAHSRKSRKQLFRNNGANLIREILEETDNLSIMKSITSVIDCCLRETCDRKLLSVKNSIVIFWPIIEIISFVEDFLCYISKLRSMYNKKYANFRPSSFEGGEKTCQSVDDFIEEYIYESSAANSILFGQTELINEIKILCHPNSNDMVRFANLPSIMDYSMMAIWGFTKLLFDSNNIDEILDPDEKILERNVLPRTKLSSNNNNSDQKSSKNKSSLMNWLDLVHDIVVNSEKQLQEQQKQYDSKEKVYCSTPTYPMNILNSVRASALGIFSLIAVNHSSIIIEKYPDLINISFAIIEEDISSSALVNNCRSSKGENDIMKATANLLAVKKQASSFLVQITSANRVSLCSKLIDNGIMEKVIAVLHSSLLPSSSSSLSLGSISAAAGKKTEEKIEETAEKEKQEQQPLQNILISEIYTIKTNLAAFILNLCKVDKNFSDSKLQSLVSLLSIPHTKILKYVCMGLWFVARNLKYRSILGDMWIIDGIYLIIANNSDINLKELCVSLLWILSSDEKNRVRIMMGGTVQKLIGMFLFPGDKKEYTQIKTTSICLIFNLLYSSEDIRKVMGQFKIENEVLRIIEDEESSQLIRLAAASVMYILCTTSLGGKKDKVSLAAFAKAKSIISPSSSCSSSSLKEVEEQTDDQNVEKNQTVMEDTFSFLLKKYKENLKFAELALFVISKLSTSMASRKVLGKNNTVAVIFQILNDAQVPVSIHLKCFQALLNLSCNRENQRIICRHGVKTLLKFTCEPNRNKSMVSPRDGESYSKCGRFSSSILTNLSKDSYCRMVLYQERVVYGSKQIEYAREQIKMKKQNIDTRGEKNAASIAGSAKDTQFREKFNSWYLETDKARFDDSHIPGGGYLPKQKKNASREMVDPALLKKIASDGMKNITKLWEDPTISVPGIKKESVATCLSPIRSSYRVGPVTEDGEKGNGRWRPAIGKYLWPNEEKKKILDERMKGITDPAKLALAHTPRTIILEPVVGYNTVTYHDVNEKSLLANPMIKLAKFKHADGASICEDIYPHFDLPNGESLHLYHEAALVCEAIDPGKFENFIDFEFQKTTFSNCHYRYPPPSFPSKESVITPVFIPIQSVAPTPTKHYVPACITTCRLARNHVGTCPGQSCNLFGVFSQDVIELHIKDASAKGSSSVQKDDYKAFSAKRSCLAGRQNVNDGGSYLDTELAFINACEVDWHTIVADKIVGPDFKNFVALNDADLLNNFQSLEGELDEIKKVLLSNYSNILRIYRYYSRNNASSNTITAFFLKRESFFEFVKDCKLVDKDLSIEFIEEIFDYVNRVHDNEKLFGTKKDILSRGQFLNILVRVSFEKYKIKAQGDVSDAVSMMLKNVIFKNIDQSILTDANIFRSEFLYCEEMDTVFSKHLPYIKELFRVYKDAESDHINIQSWSLFMEHAEIQNLFQVESAKIRQAFMLSNLINVHQDTSLTRMIGLNFYSFLESLLRLTDASNIPTLMDMKEKETYYLSQYFKRLDPTALLEPKKYRKIQKKGDMANRLDRFLTYIIYTVSRRTTNDKIGDLEVCGSDYVPKDEGVSGA